LELDVLCAAYHDRAHVCPPGILFLFFCILFVRWGLELDALCAAYHDRAHVCPPGIFLFFCILLCVGVWNWTYFVLLIMIGPMFVLQGGRNSQKSSLQWL
jgi:hypothetical protein